ncbi:MAG: hypothetical protein KJO21_02435 [Verrucomicrobiae bacterium]|nr:hypothetical protein [Verrucomicrobiae bacterium]NNJ44158.1 hypothetical protein [Akkermansiaceae bacterium]
MGRDEKKANREDIEQVIAFDPRLYTPKVQALIIAKTEKWGCPPSETVARMLEELVDNSGD